MAEEREIVEHLVTRHEPEAIVLVGSRADGHARPGSDWDLYVLLPHDPTQPKGPIPASDELDREVLDVGLVRLPVAEREILGLFGPNLLHARVLIDNPGGDAARLLREAARVYARGRGLAAAEIERRRQEMRRNLARMRARADEPGPFFEALTFIFYTAHRYWYEVLHDRWSESIHCALPEIAATDPDFHHQLELLIEAPDPKTRIHAAESIFARLFDDR